MDVGRLHDPEMRLIPLSASGERVKHDQRSGGGGAGKEPATGDGLKQFEHCFVFSCSTACQASATCLPSTACQALPEAKLRAEIRSSPSGTDDVPMNARGRRRQFLSSSPWVISRALR